MDSVIASIIKQQVGNIQRCDAPIGNLLALSRRVSSIRVAVDFPDMPASPTNSDLHEPSPSPPASHGTSIAYRSENHIRYRPILPLPFFRRRPHGLNWSIDAILCDTMNQNIFKKRQDTLLEQPSTFFPHGPKPCDDALTVGPRSLLQDHTGDITRPDKPMVNLPLIIVNGPQSFNHCVYSVSPPPNLRRRPYGPGSSIDAVLYDALQSPSVFEMRPNLLDSEPDEFFTQNQPKPAVLSRKPPKNPGLLHPRWVPRRPHPPKRLARVPSNISDGEDSKKLLTPSVGSPESQVGSASVGQDTEVTDYTYHFVQESPQDGEIDDDACDEGVDEWIYGETDEEEGDSDDDEMSQPMFPWTRPWRRQRLDEPGEWLCWVCEVTLAEGEEEAFVRVPGHPFRQRHCSYCTQLSYCKLFVL